MDITQKSYSGDVGTEILVNVGSDITGASVHKLIVLKPDKTKVEWVGSIVNLKYIKYITQAGDLTQAGAYKLQAFVVIPGSGQWLGNTTQFTIMKPFQ